MRNSEHGTEWASGGMRRNRRDEGFTLIEVLVATTILVILVLVMSSVFHQSSVAWDGGMRKAEGNMTGRAILGFMSREMSEAVVDASHTNLFKMEIHPDSATFVTLRGTNDMATPRGRIAEEIEYTLVGQKVKRTRTNEKDPYWHSGSSDMAWLGSRVKSLKFTTSDGQTTYTNMPPAWVHIQLSVERSADVSGLTAWSYGPDGADGTADDIKSR